MLFKNWEVGKHNYFCRLASGVYRPLFLALTFIHMSFALSLYWTTLLYLQSRSIVVKNVISPSLPPPLWDLWQEVFQLGFGGVTAEMNIFWPGLFWNNFNSSRVVNFSVLRCRLLRGLCLNPVISSNYITNVIIVEIFAKRLIARMKMKKNIFLFC